MCKHFANIENCKECMKEALAANRKRLNSLSVKELINIEVRRMSIFKLIE
jgi:hypothetical protein